MLTSRCASQAEPWNVEGVAITGKGIEVHQYAGNYDRNDSQVGPRVLDQDEIAWSVLFRQSFMKNIRVREMSKVSGAKAKNPSPSTFIEIRFKYEGVPESKDATQLKTVGPEEAEGMYCSFKIVLFVKFLSRKSIPTLGSEPVASRNSVGLNAFP